MKRNVFSLIILFISISLFGQDDSRLGVFLGYSKLIPYEADGGYNTKDFSIEYQDRIFSILAISYGVTYGREKIQFKGNNGNVGSGQYLKENQNILSLYANIKVYNFKMNYLYIHMGPVIDFELNKINNSHYNPQDGLGVSIGLGLEVPIKKIVISLEQKIKFRRLIAFRKSENNLDSFGDFNFGVRLGAAYKFF